MPSTMLSRETIFVSIIVVPAYFDDSVTRARDIASRRTKAVNSSTMKTWLVKRLFLEIRGVRNSIAVNFNRYCSGFSFVRLVTLLFFKRLRIWRKDEDERCIYICVCVCVSSDDERNVGIVERVNYPERNILSSRKGLIKIRWKNTRLGKDLAL